MQNRFENTELETVKKRFADFTNDWLRNRNDVDEEKTIYGVVIVWLIKSTNKQIYKQTNEQTHITY